MKEIRLSPNIGKHDVDYRVTQANKFLSKGEQVRVVLIFKGRENLHEDIGYKTLLDFVEICEGKPASNPRLIPGRRKMLTVTLNPKKQ